MISLNEFKSASDIQSLISKLFEARDFAHGAHLRTNSYAQHKALNSFYDDLLDLTDTFVETYQGQYGIIKFSFEAPKIGDPIPYFEDAAKIFIEAHSAIDKKDTHLHNVLDEIVGATYGLLYKLKFLR
jgi:hypothetical protein